MSIIIPESVKDNEIKRLRDTLKWVANGYCGGLNRNMECKTVGNIHTQLYGEGHHCPVCWMNAVQTLAAEALK